MITQTEKQSRPESAQASSPLSGWRRFVPSLGDVLFITIFSVALALGGSLTQRDGDFARHLEIGRNIIDNGQLPTVDIYSHTMTGGEMVPLEWLAQTVLAATERALGFDGVGVLFAVIAALPWVIMYRWLVKRGIPIGRSAGLALLGAAASMIHWATRPHIFTWLFVVVWVILLEDLRRGHRRQVWVLVPLAVIWINTHGAFVVGFVLIGAHLVGALIDASRGRHPDVNWSRSKHLGVILLGTMAVSFVNPVGWEMVAHPFAHMGDEFVLQFTREFNSPDFHNALTWPFLIMLLSTVGITYRWSTTSLLLTAVWTALALYSFRHIPLYALIVTPFLAEALPSWHPRLGTGAMAAKLREYASMEKVVVGGSLSVFIVVLTIITFAQTPGSGFAFGQGFFPVDAIDAIEDQPPGERVFNQFVWGGYLVYCCHPEIPVFIDGQTDYYGPDLTAEYDRTIRGRPGWDDTFGKYDIDWTLISPDTGLAQILELSYEWREFYRDHTAVIFVRRG